MTKRGEAIWLQGQLRPHARLIALGLVVAVAVGSIGTLDPLLMRYLIDVTVPHRRYLDSSVTVLLIALCYIGRSWLSGRAALVSFRVAQLSAQDMRASLLAHMTGLSADWHERTFLGEKLSRIEQDVEQISEYGADVANSVVRAFVFFIVNLAIMFSLNWRITLAVMPLLPLFLVVRKRFRERIRLRADDAQAKVGRASSSLAEHLGAVPQIQLLGSEEAQVSRTVEGWSDSLQAKWAQRRTEVAFSVSVTSVLAFSIRIVLSYGLYENFRGALTLGGLVAFYAYVTRLFEPLSTAMELYSRTQRILASVRRVREVLGTTTSVPDHGRIATVPQPLTVGLECKRVSFAYPSSATVLRDVSFQIRPGEQVALFGRSGSGKSTLSRLLARVADPTQGRVSLESKAVPEFTLKALRDAICYVPQQPVLFSGTVRGNLVYGNDGATEEEIDAAVAAAQLLPVLARLPRGLDSVLGPEAVGLSGGERQRLALARALLRHPAILILDESTSALDLPTEQAIFRSIEALRAHQTTVLISHRLRSLTWVDRIILLDEGRIVAQGTHSALYREEPLYRRLYEQDCPDQEAKERPYTQRGVVVELRESL